MYGRDIVWVCFIWPAVGIETTEGGKPVADGILAVISGHPVMRLFPV